MSLEITLTVTFETNIFNLLKLGKCLEIRRNCFRNQSTIYVFKHVAFILYCEGSPAFSSKVYHKSIPSEFQIAS